MSTTSIEVFLIKLPSACVPNTLQRSTQQGEEACIQPHNAPTAVCASAVSASNGPILSPSPSPRSSPKRERCPGTPEEVLEEMEAQVKEWARNGSFMKKPSTGWLHDDLSLSVGDGVYYPVKYIGKVAMTMSMRTLRFEDRTAVTREAITMSCEAAGVRPPKKRKVPKTIKDCLADEAKVLNLNVKLTISTTGIAVVVIGTNQVIANHIMPCISFATGGDAVDYDVIGYVAKDSKNNREIHVFDCGHMAHDVMATIGQAFELRFKAFLKKQQAGDGRRGLPTGADNVYDDIPGGQGGQGYEVEYDDGGGENPYGDVASQGYHNEEPVRPLSDEGLYDNRDSKSLGSGYMLSNPGFDTGSIRGDPIYDNRGPSVGGQSLDFNQVTYDTASGSKDYDDSLSTSAVPSPSLMKAPGGGELERPLRLERWFHGPLRREAADMMLRKNGDFLVRENVQCPGQFVLSTLQAGNPVHLLLVDPAGRVHTKDMSFNSVSHLINYHLRARIPIVSRGSRIVLGEPVQNMVGATSATYG